MYIDSINNRILSPIEMLHIECKYVFFRLYVCWVIFTNNILLQKTEMLYIECKYVS